MKMNYGLLLWILFPLNYSLHNFGLIFHDFKMRSQLCQFSEKSNEPNLFLKQIISTTIYESYPQYGSITNSFLWCRVWHYRLWSFKSRDTKLERFLHKNQHTQRKLLSFENWTNREAQQFAKIRAFKVDYFDFSCKKIEKLV